MPEEINPKPPGPPTTHIDVTELLREWRRGSQTAGDELITALYPKLSDLAGRRLNKERYDHTLEPADLIGEIYTQLQRMSKIDWSSRSEFYAYFSRIVQSFLLDYAKRRKAQKRGLHLLTTLDGSEHKVLDLDGILDLTELLRRFGKVRPRAAEGALLRAYGGYTAKQVGSALGISRAQVQRDWNFAKAWLATRLKGEVDT